MATRATRGAGENATVGPGADDGIWARLRLRSPRGRQALGYGQLDAGQPRLSYQRRERRRVMKISARCNHVACKANGYLVDLPPCLCTGFCSAEQSALSATFSIAELQGM